MSSRTKISSLTLSSPAALNFLVDHIAEVNHGPAIFFIQIVGTRAFARTGHTDERHNFYVLILHESIILNFSLIEGSK